MPPARTHNKYYRIAYSGGREFTIYDSIACVRTKNHIENGPPIEKRGPLLLNATRAHNKYYRIAYSGGRGFRGGRSAARVSVFPGNEMRKTFRNGLLFFEETSHAFNQGSETGKTAGRRPRRNDGDVWLHPALDLNILKMRKKRREKREMAILGASLFWRVCFDCRFYNLRVRLENVEFGFQNWD